MHSSEPCLCCPDYFLYASGFSLMEITRLKSHHTLPEEEGAAAAAHQSLPSPVCAPSTERGEDERIDERKGERRGPIRCCFFRGLQTAVDFLRRIDTKLNVLAWSHYDI